MDVHPLAQPFALTSDSYERGRPEYPEALFEWLGELGVLHAGTATLDLGAGTGKFSRGLLRHGASVIAIEPLEKMRVELERALPEVDSRAGGAHEIPVADASCDLVCCAQSFHWFAEDPTLAEIARVLRRSGALVLVWNHRDLSDSLQALIETIQDTHHAPGIPTSRTGKWEELMATTARFSPLGERHFPHQQETDYETAAARVLSTTSVARMDERQRSVILSEVAALVPPGTRREVPFVTNAYAYRLAG